MKLTENHNYDAKLCDSSVKFCTKCKICWEVIKVLIREDNKPVRAKNIAYYKDFPSYGKSKAICLHCDGGDEKQFLDKHYNRRLYNKKQNKENK